MTSRFRSIVFPPLVRRLGLLAFSALLLCSSAAVPSATSPTVPTVTLADQPVLSAANPPGNLALVLSVEYPTAVSIANVGDYSDSSTFLGYFDPLKCYDYVYNSTNSDGSSSYFKPVSLATGSNKHTCAGHWSGNFMNWATMQTIDPFRWALTGGFRSVDTASQTILEKAWATGQGDTNNFPDRGTSQGSGNSLSSGLVTSVTPFSNWTSFNFRIEGNGNRMVFSSNGNGYQSSGQQTNLSSVSDANTNSWPNAWTAYQVYIRVAACDTSTMGAAGLESNCIQYGSNYKPEGLLQKYANQIRYSAFGYLNGSGQTRQGGVLREPMGFIGPAYTDPASSSLVINPRSEWSATDGTMSSNPDTALATASGVNQSGVMNYLNKFGESAQRYLTYDNVSELYYAALRYYENLGNVPEWTNSPTPQELDGFPIATNWTDPIAYYCQKNFILGIGDDHTWYDSNVGQGTVPQGVTAATIGGRTMPNAVASDSLNQAAAWTDTLQRLQGSPVPRSPWWQKGGNNSTGSATYYIAGLAYGAHVLDIRPDLPNTQTISTYWMDVMEYQRAEDLNPYYLATKFGGFSVPSGYNLGDALSSSQWDPSGVTINMNGNTRKKPDNYFLAGNANDMVLGLKTAFSNISSAIATFSTAAKLPDPNVPRNGLGSFSSQYDPNTWTSEIAGFTFKFDANGAPTTSTSGGWDTHNTLQTQFAGTGWDTGRRIVTWNSDSTRGVPFRYNQLTSAEKNGLAPNYSSSTGADYLNYLRGDQTNEVGSSAANSTQSLRTRRYLLGDVDTTLVVVGPPAEPLSDAMNTGYAQFKSTQASRPVMVYAAANDGMLHALNGTDGTEQFAYVPSGVFQGPTGTPQVNGLAALGNPAFAHHDYVDATPVMFDLDLARAGGATPSDPTTSNWATFLIGGLGKGGKSFYALDITNPGSMTDETTVAGKVKWEFTDATMGYSYGQANVFKTTQFGWVVALTSGYNNSDGYGYLYLVNPATGALLKKIRTPSASNGLTYASAFAPDGGDGTADSLYAGDLNGQIWRFDLRTASGDYPAPTLLATLTDGSQNAQPITVAPHIDVHPVNRKRYIMLGTGQLLSSLDLNTSAAQSVYAIADGNNGTFNTIGLPITRSTLQAVTDLTVGIPSTVSTTAAGKGWYADLGVNSSTNAGVTTTVAWRVVTQESDSQNGIVNFNALLPQGDPCSPGGRSNVYGINFATGKTVLAGNAPYLALTKAVVNVQFFRNLTTGKTEMIAGDTTGRLTNVDGNFDPGIATKLLNWREIPTAE